MPLSEDSESYEVDIEGAGLGVVLLVPGDGSFDSVLPVRTGTAGTEVSFSGSPTVAKFGDSIEFSPTAARDPSQAFVSFTHVSAFDIEANPFTIETWVRFKDLTDTRQVFLSIWEAAGTKRQWLFRRDGGDLHFRFNPDGQVSSNVDFIGAFSWAIDTWYHVAVTRDTNSDVRLFVDGTQVGTTTQDGTDVHVDSSIPVRLGKLREPAGDDKPLTGYLDDARFIIGTAVYTDNFAPPTGPHSTSNPAGIVRTVASSTPSVLYTEAQQLADNGFIPEAVDVTVYQLSATFGRGPGAAASV